MKKNIEVQELAVELSPCYALPFLSLYHCDNMELMKQYPDKHFDLAIVDPPYGIGESKKNRRNFSVKQKNGSILKIKNNTYSSKNWDDSPADKLYFFELLRVSKIQIIFGANYFEFELLGFENTKTPRRSEYDSFLKNRPYGYIIWDKMNGASDFNDCEIIYVSKEIKSRIIYYMWSGMMQGEVVSEDFNLSKVQIGNKSKNEARIHPTQKPVKLYDYILNLFAKKDFKLLDTYFGSGSLSLATDTTNRLDKMNLHLTACEIDKEYIDNSIKRIAQHIKQGTLSF